MSRLAILLFALLLPTLVQAQSHEVRVRLFDLERPSAVVVNAVDGPFQVTVDGRSVAVGSPVRIRSTSGGVELSGPAGSASGRLAAVGPGPFHLRVGTHARSYDGRLAVRTVSGRLELVNHVALPAYVASVVASEYPFGEIEGVKAQAVLARTYARRRQGAHPTFDLDDHQGSQVYRGREVTTDVARAAVRETAGEVLTIGGSLAETPYSSSSGGHTADNEAVWAGSPLPYLRGVPDPYDADAPDHTWRTGGSVDAIHRALSARFGGQVRGVTVAERSRSGRVVTLRLDGARQSTVSGSEFRTAVNQALGARTVRSTLFDLTRRGGRYEFDGRGFGHGVGMSQYGARGQARSGRSYRQILAHYFAGTAISSSGGGVAAPIAQAEPPPPEAGAPTETATPRWPTPRRDVQPSGEVRPVRRTAPERRATAERRTGW